MMRIMFKNKWGKMKMNESRGETGAWRLIRTRKRLLQVGKTEDKSRNAAEGAKKE